MLSLNSGFRVLHWQGGEPEKPWCSPPRLDEHREQEIARRSIGTRRVALACNAELNAAFEAGRQLNAQATFVLDATGPVATTTLAAQSFIVAYSTAPFASGTTLEDANVNDGPATASGQRARDHHGGGHVLAGQGRRRRDTRRELGAGLARRRLDRRQR